jgi:hypothetical protein
MKTTFLALCCYCLLLFPLFVSAQLRLPQPSPPAMVMQTIGLTDITIKYHTPGIKGREVWGKLVPFNQVWRTGANEATLITFSDPVTINGEKLAAGTYSLFSLPESTNSWVIIFNKNTSLWGTEGYNAAEDVLRVKAEATAAPFHESFQFIFSDLTTDSGVLSFLWEKLRVSVKINVDTDKKTMLLLQEDLQKAKPGDWQIYARATDYLIQKNRDHEVALAWIDKSLSISNNFYNNWVKAQLLALKDEYDGAVTFGKKAIKLGKKSHSEFKKYESDIERSLSIWKFKRHEGEVN